MVGAQRLWSAAVLLPLFKKEATGKMGEKAEAELPHSEKSTESTNGALNVSGVRS